MANTLNPTPRRTRRYYSEEFKSQVILECGADRASIAGVALRHQVNANIVHRWLREHESHGLHAKPAFLPVTLEPESQASVTAPRTIVNTAGELPQPDAPTIRIEVWNGNNTVTVTWPASNAASCSAWLREWLK